MCNCFRVVLSVWDRLRGRLPNAVEEATATPTTIPSQGRCISHPNSTTLYIVRGEDLPRSRRPRFDPPRSNLGQKRRRSDDGDVVTAQETPSWDRPTRGEPKTSTAKKQRNETSQSRVEMSEVPTWDLRGIEEEAGEPQPPSAIERLARRSGNMLGRLYREVERQHAEDIATFTQKTEDLQDKVLSLEADKRSLQSRVAELEAQLELAQRAGPETIPSYQLATPDERDAAGWSGAPQVEDTSVNRGVAYTWGGEEEIQAQQPALVSGENVAIPSVPVVYEAPVPQQAYYWQVPTPAMEFGMQVPPMVGDNFPQPAPVLGVGFSTPNAYGMQIPLEGPVYAEVPQGEPLQWGQTDLETGMHVSEDQAWVEFEGTHPDETPAERDDANPATSAEPLVAAGAEAPAQERIAEGELAALAGSLEQVALANDEGLERQEEEIEEPGQGLPVTREQPEDPDMGLPDYEYYEALEALEAVDLSQDPAGASSLFVSDEEDAGESEDEDPAEGADDHEGYQVLEWCGDRHHIPVNFVVDALDLLEEAVDSSNPNYLGLFVHRYDLETIESWAVIDQAKYLGLLIQNGFCPDREERERQNTERELTMSDLAGLFSAQDLTAAAMDNANGVSGNQDSGEGVSPTGISSGGPSQAPTTAAASQQSSQGEGAEESEEEL